MATRMRSLPSLPAVAGSLRRDAVGAPWRLTAMSSVTSMKTWSPSCSTVEAVGSVPMPNRIR